MSCGFSLFDKVQSSIPCTGFFDAKDYHLSKQGQRNVNTSVSLFYMIYLKVKCHIPDTPNVTSRFRSSETSLGSLTVHIPSVGFILEETNTPAPKFFSFNT